MANSDKNIVITPNINQAAQPNVVFKGQGNVPITLRVLDDSFGTLSFEGSAGQLFSINNNLTSGIIFSVNDVSGIPQIDVNADGTIRLAPFGSNLQIAGLTIGKGGSGVSSNTAFGFSALAANTTGIENTAFGYEAAAQTTTGSGNVAIGWRALKNPTSANSSTAVGSNALAAVTTASDNTAVGRYAGYQLTTGGANTILGAAMYAATTAYYNVAIGHQTLNALVSGTFNTAVGYQAAIGATGQYNACLGHQVASGLTSGNYNTVVGPLALPGANGSNNVVIGGLAAQFQADGSTSLTSTSNSVYVGYQTRGFSNSDSNSVVIGYQAIGKGANTTVLGNTSTTQTWLYGSNRLPFNSASGLSTFNVAKTVLGGVHFVNGAGSGAFARNEAAITFQGTSDTEAQAGIYVTNDNSTGTHMAFATTDSYATGPQLAMTINNVGVVNFLRTQPTYTGSKIAYGSGTIGYLTKYTNDSSGIANSLIYDNGTNIGIGTTSPSAKLHVYSATAPQFRLEGTSDSILAFYRNNVYGGYIGLGSPGNNDIFIYNLNSGAVRINNADVYVSSTGNVGIGTTSPGAKLEIQTADGADSLAMSGYKVMKWESSNHLVYGGYTAGQWQILKFFTNGSERFRVDASGNFGIGNTSPGSRLQIDTGAAGTTGLTVKGFTGQTAALQTFQNSSGEVIDFVAADGYSSLHFGEIDWTPNYSGGVSSPSARTYQKTSGNANTWDGQVYSSQGFIKNVHVTFKPSQNNLYFMMGLNSDPSTDGVYVSLDYAWYCNNDGYMYIYENGSQIGSNYGTYTSSTLLTLAYDGTNVTYYKDGAIMRQVARAVGNALYLDSSFYSLNAAANSVRFGPFAPNVAAQGTANYVAKFNAANSLVNSSIQDDGTTVTITNALVANSVATPRYYSYGITAGNAVRLGQWNVTEGNVALYIQVSSDTGGHSGTSSYLYQGGFNVAGTTSGAYVKLLPLMVGRGHGDAADSSIGSTDAGGWTVFLYTGTTNAAYTMGVAVGVPTGKANKTLRVTVTELRGGMTYTADGSSIAYPTTSSPYTLQHSYGNISSVGAIGASSYLYSNDIRQDYVREVITVRTLPNVVGDYIEICNYAENCDYYEFYLMGYQPAYQHVIKIYKFAATFSTQSGTLQPCFITPYSVTVSDFELEVIRSSPYDGRFRLRRTKGTSAHNVYIKIKYFGPSSLTLYSGNGTSSGLGGYTTLNQYFPTSISPPPPSGGTGNGNSITVSAGSGVTSGTGGSVVLQPGNAAGTNTPGSIGFNFSSEVNTALAGCISYGTTRDHYFTRTVPIAAGDYVEICEIQDSWPGILEITIMTYQHAAEGGSIKQYRFSAQDYYYSGGIIQPTAVVGANGWELEKFQNGATPTYTRLRIRRTIAISASPICVAWIHLKFIGYSPNVWSYSGTGTSSISNTLGWNLPTTSVKPPAPLANNGAGRDLTVSAGSAAGTGAGGNLYLLATSGSTTGAGGSIILQPGAQASTGGDGFIQIKSAAGTNSGKLQGSSGDLKIMPESGKNVLIYDGYSGGGSNVVFQTTQTGSEPRVSMPFGVSINSFNFIGGAVYAGNYATLTSWNLNLGFRATGGGYTVQSGITGGSAGVLRVTEGDFSAGGSIAFPSSTASYSANQNDLALTGSAFQRLSAAGGLDRTITGIAPPSGGSHVDGRMMRIYNVGSANSLILAHNSTSSAANNRLWCVGQANITIALGDYAELIYDANDNGRGGAGWRVH